MRMTNEDVWKTLQKTSGEITGPVIFDFVCWVLDEAVRRKIKTLYFLARDGYILHKIAGLVVKKFAGHMQIFILLQKFSAPPDVSFYRRGSV